MKIQKLFFEKRLFWRFFGASFFIMEKNYIQETLMKRNRIALLLIVAAFFCALFALVGCDDSSGSHGGGDSSDSGTEVTTIVKVEYSYDLSVDASAYPVTVEAGTQTANYDSIPLKARISALVYKKSESTDPMSTSMGENAKTVEYTKEMYARIDWPVDAFETETAPLPGMEEMPENKWRTEFGKCISFDYKDMDKSVLALEIIQSDPSLRSLPLAANLEIVASTGPNANFDLSFNQLFTVVPASEHKQVKASVNVDKLAPFVENSFERGQLYFKTVNNAKINVTAEMIEAAYPDGDVQVESYDPFSFLLVLDRLKYKATCSYGGVTYDIDFSFSESDIDKTSYTLSAANQKIYGSPYLNWSDFYLDQFEEGAITVAANVHTHLQNGSDIDKTVTFRLPVDRSDIASCEPSGQDVYFLFKEPVEYGPITIYNLSFPCEQPVTYLFHMPTLPVAEVAQYDYQLFENVLFDSADIVYGDSHVLSLTREEIENASYNSEESHLRENNLLAYYKSIGRDTNLWMEYQDLSASPSPYTLEDRDIKLMGILKESVAYAVFTDEIEDTMQLYIKQAFIPPMISSVTEYYYDSVRSYMGSPKQRTVELPEDFFAGFNTDKKGTIVKTLATKDTVHPEQCDSFTLIVQTDTVESLSFKFDLFFDGIVVGEPVDLRNCYAIAHYTHGQTAKVPLTNDMLGSYDQTQTGEQEIDVTYNDGESSFTGSVTMTVRKVKSFTVAEGLDQYYLEGDEPDFDVWLTVTYTDETEDFVSIPPEKFASFDTTGKGEHSFKLTYGGYTLTHTYQVIEGLYLTYASGDHITFTGYQIGKPDDDAENVFVPADIKNIVLPAEIGTVPVTELKANLFAGLSILRSLVVPDTVTTVGYGVVDNCKNLKTLTIPVTVTLEKYFKQYQKKTLFSNGTYPTVPSDLTVVISDKATAFPDNFLAAFETDSEHPISFKIDFGAGISSLEGQGNFTNWQYIKGFAATGNSTITVVENVVFIDGGTTLLYYPDFKTETAYQIPEDVTTIRYMQNKNIETLTIGADVETLPEYFMEHSEKLTTVTFLPNSKLKILPNRAFYGCGTLTSLTFPDGLSEIGEYALGEIAVDTIVLPKTVTKIGERAFDRATCKRFYLPPAATQPWTDTSSYTSLPSISLPSLVDFAYDGSVALENLPPFKDSYSTGNITNLYITGETSIIGNEWGSRGYTYNSSFASPIKAVHVYGGANFNKGNLSNSVTVTRHANDEGKWW